MSVPNLRLTTVLVVIYCYKLSTQRVEGKKRSEHRDKLRSFPMLIAYWFIIILFVINRRINTIPDIIYSGIVQFTWYYIQCNVSVSKGTVQGRKPKG